MHNFNSYLWRTMNSVASWITEEVDRVAAGQFKVALQIYVREVSSDGAIRFFPCFYPRRWDSETADEVDRLIQAFFIKDEAFKKRLSADLSRLIRGGHAWGLPATLHALIPEDGGVVALDALSQLPLELRLAGCSGVDPDKIQPEDPSGAADLKSILRSSLEEGTDAVGNIIEILSLSDLLEFDNPMTLPSLVSGVIDTLKKYPGDRLPKDLAQWHRSGFKIPITHPGTTRGPPEACAMAIVLCRGDPLPHAKAVFPVVSALVSGTIPAALLAVSALRSVTGETKAGAQAEWQSELLNIARELRGTVNATFALDKELERLSKSNGRKDQALTLLILTVRTYAAELEKGESVEIDTAIRTVGNKRQTALLSLYDGVFKRAQPLTSLPFVQQSLTQCKDYRGSSSKQQMTRIKKELAAMQIDGTCPLGVLKAGSRWRFYYRDHPYWIGEQLTFEKLGTGKVHRPQA